MEFKIGSIITCQAQSSITIGQKVISSCVKVISVINEVKGIDLYCGVTICSVNGKEFIDTRAVDPSYEGEQANNSTLRLVTSEEFDIIYEAMGRSILLEKHS